jgi:hypothetical protein
MDGKNIVINIKYKLQACCNAVLDGIGGSVMGDDYISAIKFIACVKDVVNNVSCDAAINRFEHCHQC